LQVCCKCIPDNPITDKRILKFPLPVALWGSKAHGTG